MRRVHLSQEKKLQILADISEGIKELSPRSQKKIREAASGNHEVLERVCYILYRTGRCSFSNMLELINMSTEKLEPPFYVSTEELVEVLHVAMRREYLEYVEEQGVISITPTELPWWKSIGWDFKRRERLAGIRMPKRHKPEPLQLLAWPCDTQHPAA